MAGNILYYGDNLEVMRQHLADESVDLLDEKKEFDFPVGYSLKSGPARRLTREGEQRTLGMAAGQGGEES